VLSNKISIACWDSFLYIMNRPNKKLLTVSLMSLTCESHIFFPLGQCTCLCNPIYQHEYSNYSRIDTVRLFIRVFLYRFIHRRRYQFSIWYLCSSFRRIIVKPLNTYRNTLKLCNKEKRNLGKSILSSVVYMTFIWMFSILVWPHCLI